MEIYWLILLFGLVSLIYSSAGFGGGSSYLAILALLHLPTNSMRAIALLCNIIVVSGSTINYIKNNLFDWSRIWPFVILSIPLSFFGGRISLDRESYMILLAILLIMASVGMVTVKRYEDKQGRPTSGTLYSLSIGGVIGFVSGLMGLGGGVFLSPFLYLSHWADAKKIAATTSFFILANSIAGFLGLLSRNLNLDYRLLLILGVAVLIGGQIGSRMSIKKWSARQVRLMAAALIASVGLKIIYEWLILIL